MEKLVNTVIVSVFVYALRLQSMQKWYYMTSNNIVDLPALRNRVHVFRDRAHAGAVLAEMLTDYAGGDALVLAIPAGGVPVAAVVAGQLRLPMDVAVVSKITLPWNTESGYGAVAFDGTVRLNERLLPRLALSSQEIEEGIAKTRAKVNRRVAELRGRQDWPPLAERPVILVDDGMASGFTLYTATAAITQAGAERIIVAVPTAHAESLPSLAQDVAAVYCPNIRRGWSFAVAEAYEHWSDVDEAEVMTILKRYRENG